MRQYLDDLEYILEMGMPSDDRTGVGTLSVFGMQTRYNLRDGFPAVTTKKLAWKAVVSELLWFLEGSTDERRLAEILYGKERWDLADKTTIWTANADAQGKELGHLNKTYIKELGPVYGAQWRNFTQGADHSGNGTDQIGWIVDEIKTNPNSRRLIMSAWNPNVIDQMALPPCHVMAQFYVRNGELSCQMYQRSADMFLGMPFNVASYSLLTHMIANHTGLEVGDFIVTIGDAHIYKNHVDAVSEQLNRRPSKRPTLEIPDIVSFDVDYIKTLKVSDFKLVGYEPQKTIKAEMAV